MFFHLNLSFSSSRKVQTSWYALKMMEQRFFLQQNDTVSGYASLLANSTSIDGKNIHNLETLWSCVTSCGMDEVDFRSYSLIFICSSWGNEAQYWMSHLDQTSNLPESNICCF